MFHHVKELQFNARVSEPDPRFASMLLEQFGGANGELKAAMQYFTQAFTARKAFPEKYDLLMDIATEELSHLEIVGATITMLLDGVNGQLKDASDKTGWMSMVSSNWLMRSCRGVRTGGPPLSYTPLASRWPHWAGKRMKGTPCRSR